MNRMARALASMAIAASFCVPAPAWAARCLPEDHDHVVLYRGEVTWPHAYSGIVFDFVVRGDFDSSQDDEIGSASVYLLADALDAPGCTVLAEVHAPEMDSARARAGVLGGTRIIDVVAEHHGGSGEGFAHRLFAEKDGALAPIAAPALEHTNMGGFFAGDLGAGRGAGVAVWDALWEEGGHYSPHRYEVRYFRWRGGRLEPAGVVRSRRRISPDPDVAMRAMGLPFRDQTGPDLMPFAGFQTMR